MNIQRIGGQLMPDGGHHETPWEPICSAMAFTRKVYSLPSSAQAQHLRPCGVWRSSFLSVPFLHSHGVVVQVPGCVAQYDVPASAVQVGPSSGLYTTEHTFALLTGISMASPPCPLRTPRTRMEADGWRWWQASIRRRVMSSCSSAGAARISACGTTFVSQRLLIMTQPCHRPSLAVEQSGPAASSEASSMRGVVPWRTMAARPLRTSSPHAWPSWHQHIRTP
mmetsp:Transcript_50698/g.133941  ORF Transcript_50698/g.133941 Transcript_50698/m.133941 type:complete len:223 (-) Transcript_50698:489-1157(-)